MEEKEIHAIDLDKFMKESQINFLNVMLSLHKYLKTEEYKQVKNHLRLIIKNKDALKYNPKDPAALSEEGVNEIVNEINGLLTKIEKPFEEASEIIDEIFSMMEYLSDGIKKIKEKKGIK